MKKKRICAVLSAFILSAAPVFGAFAVSAEDLAVPKGWLLWHSYTSYEAGDSQLYLQNPQGEISEITGDFIHAMNGNFGKSPDDIVFMAIDENADEWDIFLYEDKTVTNLTENSGYRNEDPKWSPDGKSIVFKRGYWNADVNDFTYNLAWMDLERKEIKMLTDSLYEEAMPHFSEDGRYIYYTKYMEGYGKISRLNTETGEDELIFEEEKVNAYYPAVKNGFLYFTKWFSDDNHHDEIMIYALIHNPPYPFSLTRCVYPVSICALLQNMQKGGKESPCRRMQITQGKLHNVCAVLPCIRSLRFHPQVCGVRKPHWTRLCQCA